LSPHLWWLRVLLLEGSALATESIKVIPEGSSKPKNPLCATKPDDTRSAHASEEVTIEK